MSALTLYPLPACKLTAQEQANSRAYINLMVVRRHYPGPQIPVGVVQQGSLHWTLSSLFLSDGI